MPLVPQRIRLADSIGLACGNEKEMWALDWNRCSIDCHSEEVRVPRVQATRTVWAERSTRYCTGTVLYCCIEWSSNVTVAGGGRLHSAVAPSECFPSGPAARPGGRPCPPGDRLDQASIATFFSASHGAIQPQQFSRSIYGLARACAPSHDPVAYSIPFPPMVFTYLVCVCAQSLIFCFSLSLTAEFTRLTARMLSQFPMGVSIRIHLQCRSVCVGVLHICRLLWYGFWLAHEFVHSPRISFRCFFFLHSLYHPPI
jgi:hypothetical protein